jgi:Ser/Thr protein kinase RdoA (MazF antagonist)
MKQMVLSEETLLTSLGAWNLSSPLTFKRLPGGFTSEVWRVETGKECFIAKYTDQSQAAFEGGLRAAELTEQEGILSGIPLRTKNGALSILVEGVHGKRQPLALLRFVPGSPLQFSEPDAASLYGQVLGHTHRLLLNGFAEKDLFGLYAFLLQEDDYVAAQPGLASLICQALEKARAYETQHSVTFGVIWADRIEIVREKKTGQVGIIEWGAIEWGPLAFDVALSMLVLFPEGSRASEEFLQAYLAAAPISAQELQGLPYYKALFWARQAKYFAYRIAARVTLGDASPEGNARHFAQSRQQLEYLLATL